MFGCIHDEIALVPCSIMHNHAFSFFFFHLKDGAESLMKMMYLCKHTDFTVHTLPAIKLHLFSF